MIGRIYPGVPFAILCGSALFVACELPQATPSGDAGEDASASVDATTGADTSPIPGRDAAIVVPDAGTGSDASVADSSLPDPPDAADASSLPDSAVPDAADAAPPGPVVSTVATIPGLVDFDFTDARLAYRVGTVISTCSLPACADGAPVTGMLRRQGNSFSIAGDLVYFSGRPATGVIENIFSVQYDGTGLTNRTSYTTPFGATDSFVGLSSFLAGGGAGVVGVFRWSRSGEAGWKYVVQTANGVATNPHRIGRATVHLHANEGSDVRFFPEQMNFVGTENNPGRVITPRRMTTTGATVPPPVTDPTYVAVSARGPAVTYPVVAMVQGGTVKACPTAADCAAWIDLGALGVVINMDAESLYVGGPAGLGKCSLTEIATASTCTLAPLVVGEALETPMYVTSTHVYFRSGDLVRKVTK